jgi:hypothetical protein
MAMHFLDVLCVRLKGAGIHFLAFPTHPDNLGTLVFVIALPCAPILCLLVAGAMLPSRNSTHSADVDIRIRAVVAAAA